MPAEDRKATICDIIHKTATSDARSKSHAAVHTAVYSVYSAGDTDRVSSLAGFAFVINPKRTAYNPSAAASAPQSHIAMDETVTVKRVGRKDTTKGPPLRILSLDGGGIRGYSMLIILQELMHRTFVEMEGRAPKRHEIPK